MTTATRRPRDAGTNPSRDALSTLLASQGLDARWWSNGPGDAYGAHTHAYHKVLYCQSGSITFHTDDGDITLEPGDRLDLLPGTSHGATVGPNGVVCVEASR